MKNYEDANTIEWGNLEDMKKALTYYEGQIVKPYVYSKPIAKRFYQNLIIELQTEIGRIEDEDFVEFTWD